MSSWSKLPKAARRYILYHCMITPTLFWWYVVPFLMLNKGLSVEETGLFYTVGMLASSAINFIVGKLLDKNPPNVVMAAISILDFISYSLYFVAFTSHQLLLILAAIAVEYLSYGLYPAYPAYEYEVYSEEMRSKAYIYHYALPYLTQALTYPAIGYILSLTEEKLEFSILAVALASLFYACIPLTWLPRVEQKVELRKEERKVRGIPRDLIPLALILVLLSTAYSIAPTFVLVNLFIKKFGGGLLQIGIYESIVGFTMSFFMLPLLKVNKKWGKKLAILGIALISIAFAILGFSTNILHVFISAFILSIGESIMTPFYLDALFSRIPEEMKGSILGALAGIRKIVNIGTPLAAGLLAGISPSLPYVASSLTVVAVAILFALYG